MNNTDNIVKNIISKSTTDKIDLTTENYFKEFRAIANKLNFESDDLTLFEELLNKLTRKELKQLENETPLFLAKVLVNRTNENELKKLLSVLEDVLSPAIDFGENEKTHEFISTLSKEPKKIVDNDTLREILKISKNRVKNDRNVLKEKTDDIIKITSLMEKYFEKTLLESDNSTNELSKIKDDLNSLNISSYSQREMGIFQGKLVDIIYNIEHTMKKSMDSLNEHKEKFDELNKTIESLQNELSILREQNNIDFLTEIFNRRAYNEEVEKIEKKFSIFGANYAIVFIDIDHFKSINDNFGHSCGDAILKSFAKVLKGVTRQEDVLARYGGEEFISLVHYREEEEVIKYIKRLKNIANSNSFVYKDAKIDLKFSAGISFRSNYEHYEDAKKEADDLLYKAKKTGRNKVILEDGTEI